MSPAKRRSKKQMQAEAAEAQANPPRISSWGRLRNYFLAGVLVFAPFAITIYLAWLFIDYVDTTVKPLIPAPYNPDTYLPFAVPGLGLVIVFIFLCLVGWLTAGLMGRVMIRTGERFMARMPVMRSIYGAVKQIIETILSQQSTAFRKVVLFEYPRRGIWTIGFYSGDPGRLLQDHVEDEVVSVLLPTTPNPTSGFLLFIPKRDLQVLDMTIEEGMKMVISVGIVSPSDARVKDRVVEPKFRAPPPVEP